MKPIFVKPKEAFDALGVGTTKGYELISEGLLEKVNLGRASLITVASVEAMAARLLGQSQGVA